MHPAGFASLILLGMAGSHQVPPPLPTPQTGTIAGWVLALPNSQGLAQAAVQVAGTGERELTDVDGHFSLTVQAGSHDLRVEAYGFRIWEMSDVSVGPGETILLTILLEPHPIQLAELVVSPSTFGLLKEAVVSAQTLTRKEVEASPHMGSDLLRAMNRLPGIATHDVSAKLRVRGGTDDQVLHLLDGLELYEPYHMKYWDGSLSVVDPQMVGSVDLFTGGFAAEYGNRLAGVVSIRSLTPEPEPRTALGISAMNASLLSSGGFHQGRGSWLVLARRGFLKYVFAVTGKDEGGELEPDYYDVFGKVDHEVAPGHRLTARILQTGERLWALEDDSTRIDGHYQSSYAWVSWGARLSSSLTLETILSAGRVTGRREGEDEWGGGQLLSVDDQRRLDFQGVGQSWSYQPGEDLLLRWGGEIRGEEASYSYYRRRAEWRSNVDRWTGAPWSLELDRVALTPEASGTRASGFVSLRTRLREPLVAELGVRTDHVSYTGDRTLSPRLSMALDLARGTVLRGAWGLFHQSQGPHQLALADRDTTFYPAARAEHRILGLEHRRPDGALLRAEAYLRAIHEPWPEYRSLAPQVEGLWEESLSDRVRVAPQRSRALGVELLVRAPLGRRGTWSASYALAASEDRMDGQWVPRPMDQRHTFSLEAAFRPSPGLSLAGAWSYHSPWPYTVREYALVPVMNSEGHWVLHPADGKLNGARMPAYHRLDLRVTRRFDLRRGALFVFLDVFNVYNRQNPYSVLTHGFVDPSNGRVESRQEIEAQLGILPTLGLRWEF